MLVEYKESILNEILNGKRPVTSDFALMVEASLKINPELLINMQTRYNMALAREKDTLANRLKEIVRYAPLFYKPCIFAKNVCDMKTTIFNFKLLVICLRVFL